MDEKGNDIKLRGGYGEFGQYLDAVAKKYPKYAPYIQENRDAMIKEALRISQLVKGMKTGEVPKELENSFVQI